MVAERKERPQLAVTSNPRKRGSNQAGILATHIFRSLLLRIPDDVTSFPPYPSMRPLQAGSLSRASMSSSSNSRSLHKPAPMQSKSTTQAAQSHSPTSTSAVQPIGQERSVTTRIKRTKMAKKSSGIDPSGLDVYFRDPANHPNIVGSNENFVIVNDIYPKATVHLLILPRDPLKRKQHPFDAFQDNEFLNKCKKEASKWRLIAAEHLKEAICGSEKSIPQHDWESDILVGIHSQPSMEDLHIHVISRDLHSDFLWEKTNYTSFTTSFFVGLGEFPLNKEERVGRVSALEERDMTCWRCPKHFRRFRMLKTHLEREFNNWKDELSKQQSQD